MRKKKSLLKRAERVVRKMGRDLGRSPLGRAARGKRTRGYF